MATTYYAKAGFKTAYLQREMVLDGKASGSLTVHVGDVLYLSSGNLVNRSNANKDTAIASVQNGDYIVAQSDMTMEYGHVPVENRDYRYDDKVVLSTAAKKIAVYQVTNKDDLIITARSVTT